jgi:hypothetical protein
VDRHFVITTAASPQLLGVFFRSDVVPGLASLRLVCCNGQLETLYWQQGRLTPVS